jgi:predicted MFS family arabinose efflux permease
MAWRFAAGVSAGGIIPVALALLGDLYPFERRGRAIGWLFGAIAGGMAFGSTLGALLNPWIGWRATLLLAGGVVAVLFGVAVRHRAILGGRRPAGGGGWLAGYAALLRDPRGARTYAYILLNGLLHSGAFSWLGVYFAARYGLGDRGIGLALLGYGVPGMLLGPVIGHWADRRGRGLIIPAGLAVSAAALALLALPAPLAVACVAVTALSLGYDMTHPPLVGIITGLDPARRGQAMGINAFVLFTGFGVGPLLFHATMSRGIDFAIYAFAGLAVLLGAAAAVAFRNERAGRGQ